MQVGWDGGHGDGAGLHWGRSGSLPQRPREASWGVHSDCPIEGWGSWGISHWEPFLLWLGVALGMSTSCHIWAVLNLGWASFGGAGEAFSVASSEEPMPVVGNCHLCGREPLQLSLNWAVGWGDRGWPSTVFPRRSVLVNVWLKTCIWNCLEIPRLEAIQKGVITQWLGITGVWIQTPPLLLTVKLSFPCASTQRQDGGAHFQEEEVCGRWRLQSRAERVSHSGAGWRWLLQSGGPRYTNQDGNHYLGHQDTEGSWWEEPADPGIDCCGSEGVWFPWGRGELCAEKVATRGLRAVARPSLCITGSFLGGLAVQRACSAVPWCIMESGAKGCEVLVSGKLQGRTAKSMKGVDGPMICSEDCVNYCIDTAVGRVPLRQGALGTKVKIVLPWAQVLRLALRSPCLTTWALWNPKMRYCPSLPCWNSRVGSHAVGSPHPQGNQTPSVFDYCK